VAVDSPSFSPSVVEVVAEVSVETLDSQVDDEEVVDPN